MVPWFLPALKADHLSLMPTGLRCFRVHDSVREWSEPNDRKPRLRVGGRFDSQAGVPASWYVSTTMAGVLSETLFRDDGLGVAPGHVALAVVTGLLITEVEIARPIKVLRLEGPVFQALRIPPSVSSTLHRHDYAISRQAAEDIRDSVAATSIAGGSPVGLRWACARNPYLTSLVLWDDDATTWARITDLFKPITTIPMVTVESLIRDLAREYGYAVVT